MKYFREEAPVLNMAYLPVWFVRVLLSSNYSYIYAIAYLCMYLSFLKYSYKCFNTKKLVTLIINSTAFQCTCHALTPGYAPRYLVPILNIE